MKKKKNWLRKRHTIIRNLAYFVLYPYARIKYGIQIEKYNGSTKGPYVILLNHQTPFDQFFVGMSVKGPIYYLATEDIFSNGFVSSVIRFLVAPIPIRKQTVDVAAVKTCLSVAKEGGTICIAPEGNRTYSGRTEYINPAIVSLVKKIGLPVLLYRIEGGYGAEPRWSDCVRKGKIRAFVSKVIEKEELNSLSNDELLEIIEKELYVNEAVADTLYRSKTKAEYIERLLYVCPFCGFSKFESSGNEFECTTCHRKIVYGEDKRLKGVGFDLPFEFVLPWYEYQKDFVNNTDTSKLTDTPIFTDTATLREVIVNKKKEVIFENARVLLFGDRLCIADKEFLFSDISALTVLGKNKCNIYINNKVYQLKGDKRFNAIKYVHLFYRHKNICKGEENDKFLGL